MNRMEELHAVQLDIIKAFADLCDKHGLTYTLYCGTLLGAIRHKGFIPWDDDVDVAMPLKDYRRFRKLAHELPSPYVMQDWNNCRCFINPWIQIRADGTTHMDLWEAAVDKHHGIWIDIYPFIGAAKKVRGQIFQDRLICLAQFFHSGEYHRALRGDKPWYVKLLINTPRWIRLILGKLCFMLAVRDPEKCATIGTIDAVQFSGKFLKTDWDEMTAAEFEGIEFPVPVEYNKILWAMYGDYRIPPPENMRQGHKSDDCIIDAHKDYREYKKELADLINSDEIMRSKPTGSLRDRFRRRV